MFRLDDTICAVATPPGMGGIGIIRLSGPEALPTAQAFFSPAMTLRKERRLLLGKFVHPDNGEALDEGLLLVMPGPKSYTGEDVVEFHAHGSPSLLSRLMELLMQKGLRPAEPGEFTYRAFRSGRLDLTQAEAVEALVSAQGEAARRQALEHLTGGLASFLEPLEESLKALYLKIEARLEFSEDGIPPLDGAKFEREADEVRVRLERLLQSYRQGKVLKEGLKVALVGAPNVGKSSLLNRLLGMERAIVTPVAGTTRDVVEGEFLLKGIKVRLFDTAGLRESGDPVEAEGIRRSRRIIEEADILLWVMDASNPSLGLPGDGLAAVDPARTWFLFNKVDLVASKGPWGAPEGLDPKRCLALSCKTREGLEALGRVLEGALGDPRAGEGVLLTSPRHQGEVGKALGALQNLKGLQAAGQPRELWAEELKEAALAIGRIRGRNLPASAFEEIFTKFCIGK